MSEHLLNNPVDISGDFYRNENEYFVPSAVQSFDIRKGEGILRWIPHRYSMDWFFNKIEKHLSPRNEVNAPAQDYDITPSFHFSVSFPSERSIRLKIKTSKEQFPESPSLMLVHPVKDKRILWKATNGRERIGYKSKCGSFTINKKNFSINIRDSKNKLLTTSIALQQPEAMSSKIYPFSFVRKAKDGSKNIAGTFSLAPGEKIAGCGESFTAINKRGQKVNIFSADAQSTASRQMYKPVPFFISSRGYGIFVHSSAPMTFDFGYTQQGATTIFSGDETLDIFLFIGTPEQILFEYTSVTGRSPLPPLWSFGLWMSRFSYRSEKEVKEVAGKMRKGKFPCDVVHIDAGWFERGINCDFKFNKKAFPNPRKMISELSREGFRVSLWQIPYFTPNNPVYSDIINEQIFIKDGNGKTPTDDAILDFSNPGTIRWYRAKLKGLLEKGVAVIKADFGEAAPLNGLYASGKSGWFEHNLYPLRYNKTVADVTRKIRGENIIWARSAYAGSQRYPLHWGGDAEVSDAGMAGTLRGGLSLGLSGFSFWSHDIGGFSGSPVEELFSRWVFFGLLSSHSRVHGFPPREPWYFSKSFQQHFREVANLRYRLIPYIYAQAALCSNKGLPLMKALLLNYPDDVTTWAIEDEYLLGNDILVAPVMEKNTTTRKVYLPDGRWFNHSDKKIFEGNKWYDMKAGKLKGILLYRWGSLIPVAETAQSTAFIEWNKIKLVSFSDSKTKASGYILYPDMKQPELINTNPSGTKSPMINNLKEKGIAIINFQEFD